VWTAKRMLSTARFAWMKQNFLNCREDITKCSDEVYNKVTGIRQHYERLFGVYRLHVSTC